MMLVGIPALLAGSAIRCFRWADRRCKEQLSREGAAALAKAAVSQGDARRGAIVFYQPQLLCASCHRQGRDAVKGLGPTWRRSARRSAGAELVEAILEPSKTIRKGYETVTVVTKEGKTLTGRLVEERPDAVVLRESAPQGKSITIARAEIDERHDKGPSLMPEGLVNQLGSRQEFLDLVRYLIEIADRGPARALELRPDSGPDRAGTVARVRERSRPRRDHRRSGRRELRARPSRSTIASAPTVTAPRIAPARCRRRSDSRSGVFKNGSDPYRMYQTLTRGFGQMPPQTWMVPVQKYDVIHYIREEYLKGDNPTQYARVDRDYLGRLPKGKTRGPAPDGDRALGRDGLRPELDGDGGSR